MASYRVVLEIEVEDNDIIRSRSEDSLKDLMENADGDEYLDSYVEDEMTWLHSSFGNVEVKGVERIDNEEINNKAKTPTNE